MHVKLLKLIKNKKLYDHKIKNNIIYFKEKKKYLILVENKF